MISLFLHNLIKITYYYIIITMFQQKLPAMHRPSCKRHDTNMYRNGPHTGSTSHMISSPAVQGFLSGSTISPQKYPKTTTPTTHKRKRTSVTYGGSNHCRRDMCAVSTRQRQQQERAKTAKTFE